MDWQALYQAIRALEAHVDNVRDVMGRNQINLGKASQEAQWIIDSAIELKQLLDEAVLTPTKGAPE